ncbi:MAG: SDR family oxidoreductase [Acidimicrobiales bacterium]|jgi:NAD(P)-dependent dehydrogenase (short-subunit alcohol dehydrogenase family)|nr:SDR family oxidoreductase [Acidimicrobiales bacterium]
MGTIAITGAASGIGAATRARLESDGNTVVGIDLRDTEVIADLGTPAGRQSMVDDVAAACGGTLDGVVACAGVGGEHAELVTRINFFGAQATLAGLRPLLAVNGGAAVALSSNSATTVPGVDPAFVAACLDGEEDRAVEIAAAMDGFTVYPGTKIALAHWVRRNAVTDDWVGAGVRLNAINPGLIDTPLNDGRIEQYLSLGELYPIPAKRAAAPEEVASLIAWMLSDDAAFLVGSCFFLDGGTDAAMNPDRVP